MGKIILDDNYIKSLPITTNRIEVSWDKDKFFAKYSIVSYYSTDPERKNLAYEQLGNVPFISVTGIKNRWGAQHFPSVQFFILTTKGKVGLCLRIRIPSAVSSMSTAMPPAKPAASLMSLGIVSPALLVSFLCLVSIAILPPCFLHSAFIRACTSSVRSPQRTRSPTCTPWAACRSWR